MKRLYETLLADHFEHNRQMVFISGPRQVGKTTLAKALLPKARYFTYDDPEAARMFAGGPNAVARELGLDSPGSAPKGVVFDELHKFRKWKNLLKGFFDLHGDGLKIAVTGSARLNVYKRGGDSLVGRYFPYRVHPLSPGELAGGSAQIDSPFRAPRKIHADCIASLLKLGGFPEPFLNGTERFRNRWRNARNDQIFREDLRDLSRVQDIRGIRTLAELLGARVSSGVNFSGLAQDLQTSPDTVKSWLALLESVYVVYCVRPWHRNVANAIRKQPKVYFWDWSAVPAGGARNENFVASQLLKNVQWWNDSGLGDFELAYLRDKQQREVDFVVVRDGRPFVLVECKSSANEPLSPALEHFRKTLDVPHALQVHLDGPQLGVDPFGHEGRAIKISAADLFAVLR